MADSTLARKIPTVAKEAGPLPAPSPPAPRSARKDPGKTPPRRARDARFVPRSAIWGILPLALVTAFGLPYYRLPVAERVWHPLHEWLRPSGAVGQTAGFLAFGLFAFLWLYPIRKRFRWLAFSGSTARWLDVHIVAGILVPLVGAVHASWRFTGLIGLGYVAMVLVAASGAVGRYLYMRIPRARDGLALSREEIAAERRGLMGEIVATTGFSSVLIMALLSPTPDPVSGGLLRSFARMFADDWRRRKAVRALLKEWRRAAVENPPSPREMKRVTRLARREMAIAQQVFMLDATNAVFRYWHVAHKPFAVTAFLAVLVHVVVVVAVGSTWIR